MPHAIAVDQSEGHGPAFDYNAAAELFFGNRSLRVRSKVGYRRFSRASTAVLFAIEKLSSDALNGTFMEVNDERFNGAQIRSLYDHADFPLARKAAR